ncbi:uncharacterized protein LOC119607650 [Lucilia sericata]|uniref:uncharacterized protein LOC119607650 n=1 Tax=Lucilia sericata TaxID=13632 RepID=UPI0018A83223|nr:uncharacterized protein LOC119607650 [Lucilia sericata]
MSEEIHRVSNFPYDCPLKKINAYFEGLDCSIYDKDYVEKVECWLATDVKGQNMMNAIIVLKKDILTLINRYQFLIEVQNNNNSYLSMEVDICKALGTSFKNPVTRMVSEEAHRISNFPYACPLKKGIRYAINNFTINSRLIPTFTPALRWISNSEFFVGQKHVLRFDAFGRVEHMKMKANKKS